MANILDLPNEVLSFISDHLYRVGDIAALARANRRFFDVFDPALYTFAKDYVPGSKPWHPLRWAAENAHKETLEKVLAAGFNVNMRLEGASDLANRGMQSSRIRREPSNGTRRCHRPEPGPNEWQPQEDDTDEEFLPASSPTRAMDQLDFGDDRGVEDYSDVVPGVGIAGDGADWLTRFHQRHFGPSSSNEDYRAGPTTAGRDLDYDLLDIDDEDEYDEGDLDDESTAMFRGFRALHLAARNGRDEVVRMLLDHGGSIDVYTRDLCRCRPVRARSATYFWQDLLGQNEISGFSPLYFAICHLQASTARLLLSRGASVWLSACEPRRETAVTALHAAAATGQVELCRLILDGALLNVDVLDDSGLTPFYYAYFCGHWDSTLSFLLERGADINFLIRHPTRSTQLHFRETPSTIYEACSLGRYTEATRLVMLGADVNNGLYIDGVQDKWPLQAICQRPEDLFDEPISAPTILEPAHAIKYEEERLQLIRLMLKSGADLEAKSHQYLQSPLHYAASCFDIGALQILLAEGANVESRNFLGRTPLHLACVVEFDEEDLDCLTRPRVRGVEMKSIKLLLDHGSNINSTDDAGITALHFVCSGVWGGSLATELSRRVPDRKQASIVRMLLERGADDSVRSKRGESPFERAFFGGLLGICDLIVRLRRRAQPWTHEDLERLIVGTIIGRPHDLDALDFLLDLDLNGYLFSKSDYLMEMVERGHVEMASRYLERGTSLPPLSPRDKLTVLQEGLRRNNGLLVEQMLAMKVSVNHPDKNGHAPLCVVLDRVMEGKEGLVKALLEAGADIHFRPKLSTVMTPLEKGIMLKQQALVELMLQHQPLQNNPKAPKGVYLHAAARTFPSKRMLSTLIRSGASVNELDSNSDTPLSAFLKSVIDQPQKIALMRDAASRICATIWFLWNKDVDVNLRNKAGKSIVTYLTVLRLYSGDNAVQRSIAVELKLCIEVVQAEGPDGAEGNRRLRFRRQSQQQKKHEDTC